MKTKRERPPCLCGSYDHKNGSCLNEPEHTPTPWKFTHHMDIGGDQMARIDDKNGIFLAGVSDMNLADHSLRDANAAFIVRAVNSHEDCIEALSAMLSLIDSLEDNESARFPEHRALIVKALEKSVQTP